MQEYSNKMRLLAISNKMQVCQGTHYLRWVDSSGIFTSPKFVPSVFFYKKQFGLSFLLDAPTLWNDLPNDVRHSPFLASVCKIEGLWQGFSSIVLLLLSCSVVLARTGLMAHGLCIKDLV